MLQSFRKNRSEEGDSHVPAITYGEKLIPKCGYTYIKQDLNKQMFRYEIQLD